MRKLILATRKSLKKETSVAEPDPHQNLLPGAAPKRRGSATLKEILIGLESFARESGQIDIRCTESEFVKAMN
jgi:hypothetical protein